MKDFQHIFKTQFLKDPFLFVIFLIQAPMVWGAGLKQAEEQQKQQKRLQDELIQVSYIIAKHVSYIF